MSGVAITAVSRSVSDLARAEDFYRGGLGFRRERAPEPLPEPIAAALGLAGRGTRRLVLRLGAQRLDLVAADGLALPPPPAGNDPAFQHVAIPVRDMDAAMRTLEPAGPTAISRGGPQLLPPSSGGVTAWKFRDPDGQAVELIAFPDDGEPGRRWRNAPGVFLGIDHSALTVTNVDGAIAFFEGRFGFAVAERGLNRGAEQARLDGLDDPVVDVIALTPPGAATPHLELLHYRSPAPSGTAARPAVSATRLVLGSLAQPAAPAYVAGPDGHGLLVDERG